MQQPEWAQSTPAQKPLPTLDLRPLSTGELLDRVFFLYRARLPQFLALSLGPGVLSLGVNIAQQMLRPASNRTGIGLGTGSTWTAFSAGLLLLLSYIVILAGYSLVQAATTRLVAQLYLTGESYPRKALIEAWPHTLRYIAIELWKVCSAAWPMLLVLLAGFGLIALQQRVAGGVVLILSVPAMVYGAIAYLRNSLGIPASVIENLKVRAAMRRSKVLVRDRKWRIFLVYLLLMLLYLVAFAVQSPLLIFMTKAKAPVQHMVATAIELGLSFVISLLLTPVASISLCLLYFDERVRREAFDIDFLLRGPEAALSTQALAPSVARSNDAPGFDSPLSRGSD